MNPTNVQNATFKTYSVLGLSDAFAFPFLTCMFVFATPVDGLKAAIAFLALLVFNSRKVVFV
eukprot:scaffold1667_cov173-Amphora_coffeaeformis.AAC.15